MALSRFCEHGKVRRMCPTCRSHGQDDVVAAAERRAAANRARGDAGVVRMDAPLLSYPWQVESFRAWQSGGRSGLVALSPGLPMGDLPFAVMADLVNVASTNVLFAVAAGEADSFSDQIARRGLTPTRLLDHHFLEPRGEGIVVVADMEELQTVELDKWGRFATSGLLVLLDADSVTPTFGSKILQAPFASRLCISRQPSAMDLLVSRPWATAFGPLLYRATEAQARDWGVLPRMDYKLHVEMLRPEPETRGPEGPWDASDIPTRVPPVPVGQFSKGKARDVAISRAKEDENVLVIHPGVPVREARVTVPMAELPTAYDKVPSAWLLADPSLGVRDVLRVATNGFKATGGAPRIEDAVVLPVPADLCRVAPWSSQWHSTARQLDRVTVSLLLAERPADAISPEELEVLVAAAVALRGIPVDELHALNPVVEEACRVALAGDKVDVGRVVSAAKAYSGLAAALLVAAEAGPADLLRLAHPGFTPVSPDLPNPSLYDARRHAWRGRAFLALANAAGKDLVTAWGRFPELRFVFPCSLLLEVATAYCARHKVSLPIDKIGLLPVDERTKVGDGDREQALFVLREWSDALGIAEEHEREFLARLHGRQPERERAREGMCIPDMEKINADRDHATFELRGRFPRTNISPGSEVSVVKSGDKQELGRGLVTRMHGRRVTVEFPRGTPRLPRRCTLNLVFDAKVFEAYHSAVSGSQHAMSASQPRDDSPDGLLRAALLGEVAPANARKQSFNIPGLTDSQRESIEAVLSGGRVRLIHGPPGTGKTHTLTHLAMALTKAGHSTLVTADSNAAVDNLVVGLRRAGHLVVRVGHAPNIRDEAAEACRVDPMDAPGFVRWAAEQGVVVATTNYGAYRYLDKPGSVSPFVFDYVIHDEAGQSTAPSSLAAVMRGKRLVLAGDPLQLPPTVVSMDAKTAGLDVTLFERIEALTGTERTNLLRTQFRMKDAIVQFSNERYYDGRIETAPSAEAQETMEELPVVAFQHVTGKENPRAKSGSISNDWEIAAIQVILRDLRAKIAARGWSVAVLTPYQAQREAMRRALGDVEVSTVDGAQGREWDVVLYSSVRSNPKHRLGFLSDERRLNVAVTRARRHFFLVGDERTLRDHSGFQGIIGRSTKTRYRYSEEMERQEAERNRGRRRKPRNHHGAAKGNYKTAKPERAKPRQQQPRNEEAESKKPATSRGKNADATGKPKPRRGSKVESKVESSEKARRKPAPKVNRKPATVEKPLAKPTALALCAAKTKSGAPCKNKAKTPSKFCGIHS